jgi:cell filamentation protein
MSDKYGDDRDPYLYPGLNVMRNLLNIHQADRLAHASYELTALRAATLGLGPPARGYRICVLSTVISIRIFLTGQDISAKWIFIRVIPGFVILLTSRKRATA